MNEAQGTVVQLHLYKRKCLIYKMWCAVLYASIWACLCVTSPNDLCTKSTFLVWSYICLILLCDGLICWIPYLGGLFVCHLSVKRKLHDLLNSRHEFIWEVMSKHLHNIGSRTLLNKGYTLLLFLVCLSHWHICLCNMMWMDLRYGLHKLININYLNHVFWHFLTNFEMEQPL